MTDHTAINNFRFPNDIWTVIAGFLDNDDLARFRQICTATQFVGSHIAILQPLYNRLRAMDNTLPALLPQEGALLAFKQAFAKIHALQQEEIAYLTEHHPQLMANPDYVKIFQESIVVSLKALEARNVTLDEINSGIIRLKINPNSTSLNANNAHLTRLPVSLFQEKGYISFWKNLIGLYCYKNQFTSLNVQDLTALQNLFCAHNQLTSLNVQGLSALQYLSCHHNKLTSLNLQGLTKLRTLYCEANKLSELNVQRLVALQSLDCKNNPLENLTLTGATASIKNEYAELERSLLFKQLEKVDSEEAEQQIIDRLGADYTLTNCLCYCPAYSVKAFMSHTSAVIFSGFSYLLNQGKKSQITKESVMKATKKTKSE